MELPQEQLTDNDRMHLADLRLWLSDSNTSFSKSANGNSYCNDKNLKAKIANLAASLGIIPQEWALFRLSGYQLVVEDRVRKITIVALEKEGELKIGNYSLHDYQTKPTVPVTVEGKGDVLVIKHD